MMVEFMWESGAETESMALVGWSEMMGEFMKVATRMIRKMGMAFISKDLVECEVWGWA
jgi:hypothetical protein